MKPITPDEIAEQKLNHIPDFVIEIFNNLIAKNWSKDRSIVQQNEVISALEGHQNKHTREEIFANHWLDVEDIYRESGWKVEYNKPCYDETFSAYFTFTRRRQTWKK